MCVCESPRGRHDTGMKEESGQQAPCGDERLPLLHLHSEALEGVLRSLLEGR